MGAKSIPGLIAYKLGGFTSSDLSIQDGKRQVRDWWQRSGQRAAPTDLEGTLSGATEDEVNWVDELSGHGLLPILGLLREASVPDNTRKCS